MLFRLAIEYFFPSPKGDDAPTEGADLTISLGCTSPLQPKSDSSSNSIDVEKGEGEKLLKPSTPKSGENRNPNYQPWKPYHQPPTERQTSHNSGVFGAPPKDETSNAVVAFATEAEDRTTTDALVVLGERVNGTKHLGQPQKPPILVHSAAEAKDEATTSSQPLPTLEERTTALQPMDKSPKIQEGESDEEVSTDNPYHHIHHGSCDSSSVECYFNKQHFLCYKCSVCLSSNKEIRLRIFKKNEGSNSNQLIFQELGSVKLDPTTGQLAVTTNLGYWSVLNMTVLKVLQSNNCSVQVMGTGATGPAIYVVQFLPTDETERTKKVARSLCSKFIEELNAVAELAELLSVSMKVPPLAQPGSSIPLKYKLSKYTTYHPNALKK